MLFNGLGLLAAVAAVALLFLVAVRAAERMGGADRSLAGVLALSLVPIALAYAVARYFSLFVLQSQYALLALMVLWLLSVG